MKKIYQKIENMKKDLNKKMGINFDKKDNLELDLKRSEMRELELILSTTGKDVELKDIKKLNDGTLSYRGKKVILYVRDQYVPAYNPYKFHISWCDKLEKMEEDGRIERYVVNTRRDGVFSVNEKDNRTKKLLRENIDKKLGVCVKCLGKLKYKGFHFSPSTYKRAVDDFKLDEFFKLYETDFKGKDKKLFHSNIAPVNEYPENWSNISREYRKSKDWICEGCGKDLKDNKGELETHHIDRIKNNCRIDNLKALCRSCHEKEHENDY